ncbi:MAG: Uncharacterised protein [Oceanospirillaceae bacterium UBA2001]|nr:MAG: Uncharacterised protein [Oceanospirillaceae bacterium UBA2001]
MASCTRCWNNLAEASLITVPKSVAGSMGSPYFILRAFCTNNATKSSATESIQIIRLTAVQRWPEFLVAPATANSAALSRSASSITIKGELPPNSSTWRLYPAFFAMCLPTGTPPVKVISSMCSLAIISSPMSSGKPVTIDNISTGKPASYRISANSSGVSGVNSVGLQTTQLLVAIAGAILCATILSGWLKGVMAEITLNG